MLAAVAQSGHRHCLSRLGKFLISDQPDEPSHNSLLGRKILNTDTHTSWQLRAAQQPHKHSRYQF
ncbi:hypothetical protein BKA69DRAFT_1108301 [Paraphysoderma sedebokerense]|nr:hypothetical protein BKA69DRAFT_1108301 [Paraphysoderma sedebokerense]